MVALMQGALARMPDFRGYLQGRMATEAKDPSVPGPALPMGRMGARARPISTARLNASRRLQLRPIYHVVYMGTYRRENSSRRRLPA